MSAEFDAYSLATSGIRDLAPYDPGKPLEELERQYGISGAIKVASNENPLGPSPRVVELINRQISGIHRYPDGAGHELKKALAARHSVDMDQICLGNGSNDLLDMIARVFVGPGKAGIISRHAFIVYYLSLVYVHADIRVIDAKDYGHDLSAMAAAVDTNTQLMYIANPNNPTGTWSRTGELRTLLNHVPSSVIVVVDEAYAEYVAEPEYPNCIDWLSEYPNLIVTRTFSKIFGLAGLRIGYSVSSPEISNLLNRVRQPFNCNSLAMAAAIEALEDREHVEYSRKMNLEQMRTLCMGFSKLGLNVIDSVGNFVCVDLQRPSAQAYESLLRYGVIVRPIGVYDMPNHLRVSVGTEAENIRVLDGFRQLQENKVI